MADAPVSVRETLEAAFSAVEKTAPPPPPRPIPREMSSQRQNPDISRQNNDIPENRGESGVNRDQTEPDSAPVESTPSPESPERRVDLPRDQFGRFTAASQEGPVERQEPAPEPATPVSSDQPEQQAAEPAQGPALLPPNAWSAAAKEEWHRLPHDIQLEVDKRERDFHRNFQQRAEQVQTLEPLAQALAPYSQKFALRGIHPAQALHQLLAVQDLLERDPIEGIAYVARTYGVDLRTYATAFNQSQQPQDPALRELQERLGRHEHAMDQWKKSAEQQELARIQTEV